MDLDLDAFLDSHTTSDDDDDAAATDNHRTIDDILLNDSESDSDSNSPTPFTRSSDIVNVSSPKPLPTDDSSVNSSESLELSQPHHLTTDRPNKDSKFSSIKSNSGGDSFALGGSRTALRPLPPLFGGVRSNAKPGAALAAAAAASRSIPSPHAAAIKLRRASFSTLRKVLDTDDLDSKGSTSYEIVESGTGSEISQSDVKLLEEDVGWDALQSTQVQVQGEFSAGDEIRESSSQADEFCSSEEMVVDGANGSKVDEIGHGDLRNVISSSNAELEGTSLVTAEHRQELDDHAETSFPIEGSDKHASEIHDLSSTLNTKTEFTGNEPGFLPGSDTDKRVEDMVPAGKQSHDSENFKLWEKDEDFNLAADDTWAQPNATEDVEDSVPQWESNMGGKSAEKKLRSSMKPLELAEELEKKHAFTGLNWEEGAAAQPMRLEGVRRGSTVLGYFDISMDNTITRTLSSQAFRRDHGSPQAVAVHLNFIAVGMSRGVIVVFPSKYSPHHADKLDGKMLMLGLQGDRSYSPVTSMCFNQQGDLLFAGYHDGHFTVWDVQRVSAVKSISEHKAPLVHMLYLGQDSQATRQFNVVSGDSNGLVKLFRFSVFSWLSRLSTSRTSTLLDESRRTVLSASSLLSDEFFGGPPLSSQGSGTVSSTSIGSMMGGVVGGEWKSSEGSSSAEEGVVILVTHQSALVAKVISATPEVYAQLPKPDGVREGSIPYTAWKFVGRSQGSLAENVPVKESENVPLLAMAWDRNVQVAKLVKPEKSEKTEKLELKIYGKWTLESSAIGVAWLDDQMLVILTSAGQLYLYAKDGTVIHQTSFAVDGPQVDDLIGYHTHFTNTYGNPEKAYHNFVAVRGATVYILGPTNLVVSRLLPWKERIEVLRKAGDWMGALNMAMTLYDGHAHGVIDLPRTLDDVQKAIMPYLVELLLSYVDEVFSYMSVACSNQIGKLEELDNLKSESSLVHMEIKDQFTRVGGVAVEFCVHIKRTDILFDEILSRFVSAQHKETFLELLEPYILKDMLGSLPPEIMQVLVEHYSTKGWLQRVEQCVLHMDISSLDFNQVVRLCREHRLYGALIYLFNKGLDDFRAPLEELLAVLKNSNSETAAALGYRMLVYLKYCFSGLAFPPGHGTLPPQRLPSLRMELIQFLLEDCNAPSSWAVATKTYKNLYHLLELDTEATLDVLRCAFVEELPQMDYHVCDSTNLIQESMNERDSVAEIKSLTQRTVDVLALVLEAARSSCTFDALSTAIWPSKDDIGCIIEFIANYVASEKAEVSKELLQQMLEYLTTEVDLPPSTFRQKDESLRKREKMILTLLEVVPETDWDGMHLLHLCEKAQFYQVCGLIHGIRHRYLAALESYMKDVDEPIHTFSFIYEILQLPSDSDSFQAAIISRVPDLVQLNREGTFLLVADRFSQESQHILAKLRSYPQSLFLYLKTVTEVHSTGTLDFSCLTKGHALDIPGRRRMMNRSDRTQAFLERISLFPKLMRDNPVQVTDEMTEMYLELLCQYERNSVLPFLETCESYRVEHCLRVCQEHGIIDAAAFLWERVGDVGSALLLTLSDLNDRFIALDVTIQRVLETAGEEHFNAVSKKKEVKDILDVVHACVGLCQRNSSRLDPEESEYLWFQLLDSFCEPLIDSYSGDLVSEGGVRLVELLGKQEEGEACKTKWKVRKSHRGAHIFRKLFSMFIKEIVEGMVGYVRLPTIMMKLLSDNGTQEFGDFRVTILGMLGTYDFERRILDTAKSLIEDDTYYTMSLLKKGASHGYGPRSLQCCICNCPFTKGSSTSSIRVFSCGHATHLHCELQEKDSAHGGYSSGCPICMTKKKAHKSKSKSAFTGNGLVSNPHPKGKLSQGIVALHPHENDAADGSRQISRFEILNSLQKEKRMIQVENMPQLRLAPPTVYHEKVKKGADMLKGESSSGTGKIEKTIKNKQIRDVKVKGLSSIRFPMKTNIFGKEKTSKR